MNINQILGFGFVSLGFILAFVNMILFIICVIIGVAFFVFNFTNVRGQEKRNRNRWERQLLAFADENNINKKYHLFNQRRTHLLVIEDDVTKVHFFNIDKGDPKLETYFYTDIIESHITEDDVSVIKTSRSNQLGGAIIGGAILGGIGAIIGGLSGAKTEIKQINKLSLDIVVNNIDDPLKRIVVLESRSPISKSYEIYKNSRQLVDEWFSLFKVITNNESKEQLN